MKKKRTVTQLVFFLFVIMVAGLLILKYNRLTPLHHDDYSYMYSFYDGKKIETIGDILKSLSRHYYIMNGRLVTHFLAHFYLTLNPFVADVINTGAFLLLGLLVYGLSNFKKENHDPCWLACIYMLLFWVTPAFGDAFLWIDASATYLHGMCILLLFLMPYWRHFVSHSQKSIGGRSFVKAAASLVGGVLAGGTNENTSVALIAMVCAILLVSLVRKDARAWMVTGLMGAVAGCLFMLKAPGNARRVSAFGDDSGIWGLLQRFPSVTETVFELLMPLVILYASLFLLYLLMNRGKDLRTILLGLLPSGILLLGALASSYALTAVPTITNRLWVGTVVFGTAACGCLVSAIDFSGLTSRKFAVLLTLVFVVFTLFCYRYHYGCLDRILYEFNTREASIREQMAEGKRDIYVNTIYTECKYSPYEGGDLMPDPGHWTNTSLAKYWGVDSIIPME